MPALFGLVFLVCGLYGLGYTAYHDTRKLVLRGRGVRTTGTVVDHVPYHEDVHTMVVEFVDVRGVLVSGSFYTVDTYGRVVPHGEQLDVLYLPHRPQDARPVEAARGLLRGRPWIGVFARLVVLLMRLRVLDERRLRQDLRQHGIRAVATVTRHVHQSERTERGQPLLCPLVEFTDEQGRTKSFPAGALRGNKPPAIGEDLPVVHRQGSPGGRVRSPRDVTPDELPSVREAFGHFLVCAIVATVGFVFLAAGFR